MSTAQVRAKSLALTDLFLHLIDEQLPDLGPVLTPRDHRRRGSQVALSVAEGYPIMPTLIERGVIGDFRAPDIMRFGFAPYCTSMTDVWDAAMTLSDVMQTGSWREMSLSGSGQVT